MAIPPVNSWDVIAAHCEITGYGVFECVCDDVAVMWEAVCEWWAVEEDEFGFPFPLFYGTLENVFLFPVLDVFELYLSWRRFWVDWSEHKSWRINTSEILLEFDRLSKLEVGLDFSPDRGIIPPLKHIYENFPQYPDWSDSRWAHIGYHWWTAFF